MTTLGSLCLLITLCLHSVSDSEDSESDDEPLAAKKNEPPSVSDPSPLICCRIFFIIAFIRTVTFKRGSSGSGSFMWYAQLGASGIFHVFIYEWLYQDVYLLLL